MKKALALSLMCFMVLNITLHAQEEDDYYQEGQGEYDWYGDLPSLYSAGDKTFNISPGITIPALFINKDPSKFDDKKVLSYPEHNFNRTGGAGALAFNYFINSNVFLGGEIGGQFIGTLAKNTSYIIPIGFRSGYQFLVWRLEIPLTMVIGIAPQTLLNYGYAGLFIKGGPAVFYRFNPDWSFGVDLNWAWFPQWTSQPKKNAHGNFIQIFLSARYHF